MHSYSCGDVRLLTTKLDEMLLLRRLHVTTFVRGYCMVNGRCCWYFRGNRTCRGLRLRDLKLDCISWNSHNTVFGSKRSAICALVAYFLHWLMSALSAVPSTCVRRCRKFGEFSCTERTGQGNDSELIPTIEMETRHPVEGLFRNEFPSIYNNCGVMANCRRKTLKKKSFCCVFKKMTH